jgi:hypothetical protein
VGLTVTWQPNAWRGNYPHLSSEDAPIWTKYLSTRGATWDEYAYDVAVGGQECPPDVPDDTMRQAWRFCTAKRIDVLARRRGARAIIEVRYQAGVSAVGALLVYKQLLTEDSPSLDPTHLLLLTDSIAPDTARAAQQLGIEVYRL